MNDYCSESTQTAVGWFMNLEDCVRFLQANCGGIVVGSLETGKFLCAECGQEMTAFVSAEEEARLEEVLPFRSRCNQHSNFT